MTVVQVLLLIGTGFIGLIALNLYSRLILTKIIFLSISCFICFLIIFPNYTTLVANKLGVTRGVDIIFYFFILFSVIILMKLYWKIKKLQHDFTKLVREFTFLENKTTKNN